MKTYIGQYPNTYTYTKQLAEKSLFKKRGNVNVVLFRPSIIAGAYKDPFPGWTDSLSAAGGLSLLVGLGLVKDLHSIGHNHFDVIPVDAVTNAMIISTANQIDKLKREGKDSMTVFNCGTSVTNPITMEGYGATLVKAYKFFSFNKKQDFAQLKFHKNKKVFEFMKKIRMELPIQMMQAISNMPLVGTPEQRKKVETLAKAERKISETIEIFHYFVNGDWHYVSDRII